MDITKLIAIVFLIGLVTYLIKRLDESSIQSCQKGGKHKKTSLGFATPNTEIFECRKCSELWAEYNDEFGAEISQVCKSDYDKVKATIKKRNEEIEKMKHTCYKVDEWYND